MDKIIQIVPSLPPNLDGVGDYALQLAHELKKNHSIQTYFVVCNTSWRGNDFVEGFPTRRIAALKKTEILRIIFEKYGFQSGIPVLLHYVGYAYEDRGCPMWLLKGLKASVDRDVISRLVTMVHAVSAFGPPWRSSFWTNPLQNYIARNLVRTSHHVLTNCEPHAKLIRPWLLARHGKMPILPVWSNVGEPEMVGRLSERENNLLIFAKNRDELYRHPKNLQKVIKIFKINKLYDVGPSMEIDIPNLGVPVVSLGPATRQDISAAMLVCKFALLKKPTKTLAISSIFAAICAHGVFPILDGYEGSADGLKKGIHYLVADELSESLGEVSRIEAVADSASQWYKEHSIEKQCPEFIKGLLEILRK